MSVKKIMSLLSIAILFQISSMTAFAEDETVKYNDDKGTVPTANPIDNADYSKAERDEEAIKSGFSGAREATAEQIEESKNQTGDINFDGKVDISDLSELSLALIGDKKLTKMQQKAADVDGDGRNTLADLAKYRQYISKVIPTLAPETQNPGTIIPVTEDPPEPSRAPSGVMSGNEYIFNGVSCNEYTTDGIGFMSSGTYIIASGDDLEKCISDIPDFIGNNTERVASVLEKATGYENPDEEYFKNNVLLIINSYEGSGSYKLFFDGLAMDKAGDKVTLTSKISRFSPYGITCDMKEWNFLISVPKKAFAGIGLDNVTLISDINKCIYDDRKFDGGVEANYYKQDEDTVTVYQNTSSSTLSEDKLIKEYLSSFDDFNLVKENIGMDEIKNNTSAAALEVRKNINANYFDKGGRIVYLHIPEGSGSIKVKFDRIDVSGNNITVFYDDRVPEDMALTDDMKYHNLFVCIPSGLLSEVDETHPVTVEAVSVG